MRVISHKSNFRCPFDMTDASNNPMAVPVYASPAVRAVIEQANPYLNMYELAERMSISVERLVTVRVSMWLRLSLYPRFPAVLLRAFIYLYSYEPCPEQYSTTGWGRSFTNWSSGMLFV